MYSSVVLRTSTMLSTNLQNSTLNNSPSTPHPIPWKPPFYFLPLSFDCFWTSRIIQYLSFLSQAYFTYWNVLLINLSAECVRTVFLSKAEYNSIAYSSTFCSFMNKHFLFTHGSITLAPSFNYCNCYYKQGGRPSIEGFFGGRGVLGFELRASFLLGRHSTIRVMPPAILVFSFQIGMRW
jgi:hypothetical protein